MFSDNFTTMNCNDSKTESQSPHGFMIDHPQQQPDDFLLPTLGYDIPEATLSLDSVMKYDQILIHEDELV